MLEGKTDALEESLGSPEEDEAPEEAGAGDMVGGSVSLCQPVFLLVSFSACFLHPFSFIRCQQGTRYWESPGQQAGSEVRAQGQQSPGQAVTECSVLEREDWSGAKVADHET